MTHLEDGEGAVVAVGGDGEHDLDLRDEDV